MYVTIWLTIFLSIYLHLSKMDTNPNNHTASPSQCQSMKRKHNLTSTIKNFTKPGHLNDNETNNIKTCQDQDHVHHTKVPKLIRFYLSCKNLKC